MLVAWWAVVAGALGLEERGLKQHRIKVVNECRGMYYNNSRVA